MLGTMINNKVPVSSSLISLHYRSADIDRSRGRNQLHHENGPWPAHHAAGCSFAARQPRMRQIPTTSRRTGCRQIDRQPGITTSPQPVNSQIISIFTIPVSTLFRSKCSNKIKRAYTESQRRVSVLVHHNADMDYPCLTDSQMSGRSSMIHLPQLTGHKSRTVSRLEDSATQTQVEESFFSENKDAEVIWNFHLK